MSPHNQKGDRFEIAGPILSDADVGVLLKEGVAVVSVCQWRIKLDDSIVGTSS